VEHTKEKNKLKVESEEHQSKQKKRRAAETSPPPGRRIDRPKKPEEEEDAAGGTTFAGGGGGTAALGAAGARDDDLEDALARASATDVVPEGVRYASGMASWTVVWDGECVGTYPVVQNKSEARKSTRHARYLEAREKAIRHYFDLK
jgi:hypothetical protein